MIAFLWHLWRDHLRSRCTVKERIDAVERKVRGEYGITDDLWWRDKGKR